MDRSKLELLKNVKVVLVRTKIPENIGAAARAVANMGLGRLAVVKPASLAPKAMRALATSHGEPVLEAMQVCATLEEALADCNFAVATTARQGSERGSLLPPRQAAPEILEWAAHAPVAIMFGPEDRGLQTLEIDRARLSVCIPTSDAASLNLAQSVVVLGYELRMAAVSEAGLAVRQRPQPAPLGELYDLIDHLTEAFTLINRLPEGNPRHFMRTLKSPLERAGMTSREVRAWRGVARQITWMASRLPGK